MIALDTHILVQAHREDAPHHRAASEALRLAARGPWAIPWHCYVEFYGTVTHPRKFNPPTTAETACAVLDKWRGSGTLVMLSEMPGFQSILAELLVGLGVTGGRVHDAKIAAVCLQNGVTELLTADRDFRRFPGLKTRNPLLGG